jgi:hypothetical protein
MAPQMNHLLPTPRSRDLIPPNAFLCICPPDALSASLSDFEGGRLMAPLLDPPPHPKRVSYPLRSTLRVCMR